MLDRDNHLKSEVPIHLGGFFQSVTLDTVDGMYDPEYAAGVVKGFAENKAPSSWATFFLRHCLLVRESKSDILWYQLRGELPQHFITLYQPDCDERLVQQLKPNDLVKYSSFTNPYPEVTLGKEARLVGAVYINKQLFYQSPFYPLP